MRTIISLNDNWSFVKNPVNLHPPFTFTKDIATPVCIPHTWNAQDGQSSKDYLRTCCAYQRTLSIPNDIGSRFYLEFQGVNAICIAYINNTLVGEHRGGYSTFRFDITNFCTHSTLELTVLVDNSPISDINPLVGDFTIFGGIYRDVSLICVPEAHFDLMHYGTQGVYVTPKVNENESAHIEIKSHIICPSSAQIEYKIFAPNCTLAASAKASGNAPNIVINISNPVLWNGINAPYIYTLKAYLISSDCIQDEVTLSFGLRSFSLSATEGFFLNGQSMPLRGVARHQDRQACGNAVSMSQLDEDMEIMRELGINTLRLSHYQHSQYFYDMCDREGLVVWAEIPMLALPDDEALVNNACSQLTELILQNLHHPCIFFWGLQNEIAIAGETMSMYRNVERLQELAHSLDSTRLTTSANLYCVKNNSPLNFITDIVAYNVYFGWYYGHPSEYAEFLDSFHADNPNIPIGISEYGVDANPSFHSDNPRVKDYSEEYQSLFHETVYPIINERPYVWGSFIWNIFDFGSAFRDEGGIKGRNGKGLVSYDRKLRKDAFYFYKALWSKQTFVHINSRRFYERATEYITVRVYSNLSNVTLKVNNVLFATLCGKVLFEFHNVPLNKGENIITAHAGIYTDSVTWQRVEAPNLSYIYNDPNPGFNVENWFTLGQTEMDIFPNDSYSLMSTIGELLSEPRAMALIEKLLPILANDPTLENSKSFTLLKIINRMSGSLNEKNVQQLNSDLNLISKSSNP